MMRPPDGNCSVTGFDLMLVAVFLLGLYLGVSLQITEKIPLTCAPSGVAGLILLWRRRDCIDPRHIAGFLGVLALFLGVTPPADPFAIGLGAFLSAIGLWNLTNPRPLGIALGGIALVFVGLYNIVGTILAAAGGGSAAGVWPVIGFWQLVWGGQAFGRYRRFGPTVTLSDDPVSLQGPCRTGEHTRSILAELELSPERIEALLAAGIAGTP